MKRIMTLKEIFSHHNGRQVGKSYLFLEAYETHFASFRDKPIRLLEIGVNKGGSLQLWRKYFGKKAIIHGIDIDPSVLSLGIKNCDIHIGSQNDPIFLKSILDEHGPFDIVIDDGSHLMQHQITSFETIYPTMSENGVYVCEDSFTSFWSEYGGDFGGPKSFIGYAKNLLNELYGYCLLYTSPSPRDKRQSRMPSSA